VVADRVRQSILGPKKHPPEQTPRPDGTEFLLLCRLASIQLSPIEKQATVSISLPQLLFKLPNLELQMQRYTRNVSIIMRHPLKILDSPQICSKCIEQSQIPFELRIVSHGAQRT